MTDNEKVPSGGKPVKPNFGKLPHILGDYAEKRAYLVWVPREREGGGFDKVPCDPTDGVCRKIEGQKANSARNRAVLTFWEALRAVESLEARGIEAGIGVLCSKAGFTALDLDRVVKVNGKITVEGWAEELARTSYRERSPGGAGMRVLFSEVPEEIAAISNGVERNQVGVYGLKSAKFVTLTGAGADHAIMAMPDWVADKILERWRAGGKGKGQAARPWTGHERSDGYASGAAGMEQAAEDILEGASLHPALAAYLVRAVRLYPIDEAEEMARALYFQSRAKEREPERWAARADSINRLIDWIKEQKGYRPAQPTTQQRQAAKAVVLRAKADMVEAGKRVYQTDETAGEDDGPEPDDSYLFRKPVNQEDEVRLEEIAVAVEAHTAREGNDRDRHRWMLDAPSYWFREIAKHLNLSMAMDMPGAAALGALCALSTLSANRYYVEGKYQTGLNLYGMVTAPTGAGKDAIVGFLAEAGNIAEVSTSSRVTSAGAIHELLLRGQGKASIVIDEYAKVLKAAKQDQSGNSTGAAAVLLAAHGKALEFLPEQTYSQRAAMKRAVAHPFLTTFGASTGRALEDVLDASLVSDGTLNRTLIIDGERANGGRWPVLHMPPRKAELIEGLTEAFSMRTYTEHPGFRKTKFLQAVKDEDGEWQDKESLKVRMLLPQHQWFWLRAGLDALEADLGELGELAARFERNAIVVAGLLCMGDYIPALDDDVSELVISDEQMRWALKFVDQGIRELAQRFNGQVAQGAADEVLIDARRRLIKELNPKTRSKYAMQYAFLLDQGLVPSAVMGRCMPKARVQETRAFSMRMEDEGWLECLLDDERLAMFAGRKGRPPKEVFRVLPDLYG